MKITRHMGRHVPTNTRIVLLQTILENTEECLITHVDTLPANLKDAVFHALNSDEGQREINFMELLGRRFYNDAGTSILAYLHTNGHIKKESIDNVNMLPNATMELPLRDVLVQSGLMQAPVEANVKFNPHLHNAKAAQVSEALGSAQNLLIQAEMLEADAKAKREEAYLMAPSLRPVEFINAPKDVAEIVNDDSNSIES